MSIPQRRSTLGVALALLLVAPVGAVGAVAAADAGASGLVLQTVDNRADLISDGDALLQVTLAPGEAASGLTVTVSNADGTRDVTADFVARDAGHYLGLIDNLADGANLVTARLADGVGATLTVTNYPVAGPIFSGPQIQPWTCLVPTPDPQCQSPTRYSFFYISTDSSKSGFQPYDPANPATDVATTTTDEGKTVPFIVRQETGTADRGQYADAVLYDPTKPFRPTDPQPAWDHKMTTMGGAGCGTKHGATAARTVLDQPSLARGWLVATSGLIDNGQNCNLVVQAEALMMLREHVIDTYGTLRYDIGNGCSGGAIMLQQVANAYPGLLDGLVLRCSFPDSFSGLTETFDCSLLLDYWTAAAERGEQWAEPQKSAVAGQQTESPCLNEVDVYAFHRLYDPHNKPGLLGQQNCGVVAAQAFDETTNPTGVRCSLQDYMVNEFGRRTSDGFANRPVDNVGVQYGLDALRQGLLTADQFVDLNVNIGSYNINYVWQPQRAAADPEALKVVYRSGALNEANNMAGVPIMDMRGHTTEDIHQDVWSWAMRARLDAANGGHANQVYWVGPGPDPATPNGDNSFVKQGPLRIDSWLTNVQNDHRDMSLATKVADDRPANATDTCYDGIGQPLPDQSVCGTVFAPYTSPRMVAGEGQAYDIEKCQLMPLNRSSYPVTFTDAQWTELQTTFPSGVCDWSKPGVDQQGAVPWLSYASGPGGSPLGTAPTSTPLGTTPTLPELPLAVILPIVGSIAVLLLRRRVAR